MKKLNKGDIISFRDLGKEYSAIIQRSWYLVNEMLVAEVLVKYSHTDAIIQLIWSEKLNEWLLREG